MDIGSPKELIGLVAVILIFGGGALTIIVGILAENWRKARIAEQNAVLKAKMLDSGFTADEIIRVINANGGGKVKMVSKEREPLHST